MIFVKQLMIRTAVLHACLVLPTYALAVQVGDIINEYDQDEWSFTERVTVDDVEYLYTFKGVQHYQSVVTKVVDHGWSEELRKIGDIEGQLILESAIPLTGNYDLKINVASIVDELLDPYKYDRYDELSFWQQHVNDLKRFVIGDSCFENNELINSVSILRGSSDYCMGGNHDVYLWNWGVDLQIQETLEVVIGKRAFYGAENLKFVEVSDAQLNQIQGYGYSTYCPEFKNLQLKKIDTSAFEGCAMLVTLGIACDELEKIEGRAFYECHKFRGIVSDYDSLCHVGIDSDGYSYMSAGYWSGPNWVEVQYVWVAPKLAHVGEYAFCCAGDSISGSGFIKSTFGNPNMEIDEYAFQSCCFLAEIHFPSNAENIASRSFRGLNAGFNGDVPTKLYFGDALESIESEAFAGAVVGIDKWPSNLKTIGRSAFGSMSVPVEHSINDDRTEMIRGFACPWTNMPTSVTNLGDGAFSGTIKAGGQTPVWRDGKINYLESAGGAGLDACGPFLGTIAFPLTLNAVPSSCFSGNSLLEGLVLHSGVVSIGSYAFCGCSSLSLTIPSSVTNIGFGAASATTAYYGYRIVTIPGVKSVIFEGKPPKGLVKSGFLDCSQIMVPVEFAAEWAPYMNERVKLAKKIDGVWTALGGSLVSAKIRDGVPNVMDITYKATSIKPTSKVRLVAFKGGTRSFANATIPATFVADTNGVATAGNVGDAVVPNMEHTVSWQVSSDWGDVKLAKISVEVFVLDDELLPLQLMTLPANDNRGKLTFSTNTQSAEKIANALYWLLASHEADLKLENGVLTRTDTNAVLANGTTVNTANALAYIYGKMGYEVLTGDNRTEVNNTVRLSLGDNTYAVKVEAK